MKERSKSVGSSAAQPLRLATAPTPATPPFRAVLLDDDEAGCAHFRSLLRRHPSILLTGEAHSFKEAVEMILQTQADLLFLESKVGGLSILDECHLIPTDVKLIFLTSHPDAAVRAFELDALDFLVKPVSSSRLAETIRRLLRIDWKRRGVTPESMLPAGEATTLIPFERGRRGVSLNEIALIQACGNYTRVVLDQGEKNEKGRSRSEVVLRSLTRWEQLLPMPPFLRVHRNAVVHSKKVLGLEECGGGSVLRLDGNEEKIPISRRCLAGVRRALFTAA